MVPIQLAAVSSALAAFGLLMVTLPALVDDLAAAEAGDPFERVAGQAFIGLGLEHEALEVGRAGLALAFHDLLRGGGQLVPGLGRLQAVLLEQVLAVEQQAGVGEPGHAQQLAVDGVVGHDGREVLGLGALAVLLQVDQVVLDDAGPDHVDHDHVDVGRLGGELLAQQGQVVGGAGRRGVQLDRVAVLLAPLLGELARSTRCRRRSSRTRW